MKRILLISSLFLMTSISNADALDKVSVGIGVGVPYGLIGANINYQLNETFDATLGAGLGFGAGVRYHPFESTKKFRVLAYYGTNGGYILKTTTLAGTTEETKTFTGLNFGFGYGNISDGWDIDIVYSIKSQEFKDAIKDLKAKGAVISGNKEDTQIDISFGYHW